MNTSLTTSISAPNRILKGFWSLLLGFAFLLSGLASTQAQPTLLVDPAGAGGFELGTSFTANGWTVANSANNPWIMGTANTTAPFAGNSAYISTDGSTPGYLNTAAASNFFWRDIVVPAGQERVNVSFNWLSGGESTTSFFDCWQVFFVPATTTPVGATVSPGSGLTLVPSSLAGGVFVGGGNLQSAAVQTFSGAAYLPAGSYRLVFHWKNDGGGGTTPGASIDNISVSSQATATFTSAATGNWSDPATWGGSVPSPADNIIVAAGHTVTIDAIGQGAQSVTVAGTLTFGATPTELQAKDLTVETGGLVNVFSGTTAKILRVSGNLVNNGRVNTLASSTAHGTLNLNGASLQIVSGSGAWGGTASSTTSTNEVGVIGILSITNSATSIPRVNYTMGGTLRIRNAFTVNGAVNLNGSTWIAGNYAAMGTLTFSNNGGFMNGTYGRWYTTGQTGTSITAGADPSIASSSALSLYPMLNMAGVLRYCWITRTSSTTTGNTAGEIRVTYTNEGTAFTGNAFTDGAYNVSNYWPGTWSVSTASGYVYASGTHTLVTMAPGLYVAPNGNARLMVNGGTFVGNHQLGSTTPGSQRTGLTTVQLTSTNGFVMGVNSSDICSVTVANIPFNEGFETGQTHNAGLGGCFLTQAAVVGTNPWSANNTFTDYNRTPRSGAWSAFLRYSNTRWLFIPLNLTGNTSYTFSMHARQDGTDPLNASVAVAYGAAGTAAAMTNPIVASTGLVNGNYQLITGTFTPSSSGVYFIGINGTLNGNPWYITIDDISIIETPSCVPPIGLTASSITNNGASLSWTASASSNNYEVAIQAAGAGVPTGAGVAVSGTSYAATGLNAATNYEYYVRTVCSGANSPWAGPFAFSTAVCAPSSTCNYTINMTDVYGDGWDGTVIGLRQSGMLVGTFGGAGFATGGSATATIALCPGLSTEIVLVTAGLYPDEKRFTIVDPFGVQVYALSVATTPLPTTFGTFTSSCTPPACQVPSGLTASAVTTSGATIAWTAGGTETSWEVSIQAPGLGAPSGNGTVVTANPYVATGLTSNTSYDVYLRSVCSPTNKSSWIGPISIRTLCGVFTTPLFESFEVTQGTAFCWSGNFAAGSTPGWQWIRLPSGSAPSNQTPALPDTMAMRIPFYGISSGSFSLNSPTFTATTAPSVLRFNYAYAAYSAAEIDQLEILGSNDAGTTYTSLTMMDGGPAGPLNTAGTTTASFVPTAAQWGVKSLLIPTGTNKVSFKGISAYGNNLYIDNVSVTPCSGTATAVSASICQGQSYNFGTQTLTASGVYNQTLVASTGCDSVVSLTLTVKPNLAGSVSASICQGQTYTFGSQSLSASGTYNNTVAGSNGCDSVVTLTLTVTPSSTSTITETVPNGGSFTVCGQVYNASGTYTKVCAGAAANGCDSVVTLNLTVEPPVSVSIGTRNACYVGDTVSVPVQMAFGRGIGAISLALNYDTTKLTFVDAINIHPSLSTMLVNAAVFGGASQVRAGWYATSSAIDLSGSMFTMRFVATASTTLDFDLATPGNCEIADFDAVPVAGATFSNGSVAVGQMLQANFAINGQAMSAINNTVSLCQDQNFTFTLTSVSNGSAPLNLTWEVVDANNVPVSGISTSASNAGVGAVLFNLNGPLTPGNYTVRATSISEVNGCAVPSTALAQNYTYSVVVKPRATATLNETIPYNTTFSVCGQVYSASGTYTKVCAGAAANGCDSVVTLNLTILPPACATPSGLASSAITANGATFAWTAGGTETAWEVSIQTSVGVPTGNGTAVTTNPYTATGLASNTVYHVYLRAVCNANEKSPWIGPVSFRTLCSVFTLPFFESFETAQGTVSCWSGNFAAGSTPGWQYIRLSAGSAPSNQTPALADTFAMRIPFYGIESGSFSLNTPTFTANPVGAILTFNYAYAAYSSAEIDKLEILASTDGGATYSSLEIMNGGPTGPLNTAGTTTSSFVPTSAQWGLKTVNLPANTNRISFKGISEYGNNLYLDNIRVANPPPCTAPTAPAVVAGSVGSSTVSISWTAPASAPANGYQLFVSTSTTAPTGASVPTHSSATSPAALTGLNPATVYSAWVRSACAVGTSSWVGPVSFTTNCLESNVPTTENFDSYTATGGTANTGTAVPPCWTRANGTSTSSAWRVFALTGSNIGTTSGDNILASFPTVTTAKSDWAFTTGYNLVGGTTYTLRFKVRAPGNGPNRERLGVYLANTRSSTSMLAGPRVFNDSLLQASGWQSRSARFTPAASGVYYLGIRAYSVANAGYIGIDDWSLEVTTSEISGVLRYQGGASVLDNSTVTLTGAASASATTGANGSFALMGLGNGAVTLTASTNKAWGGITATDALATTRHYQGIGLVSGLNLAAADVNLSNLVNATDALMIINRFNGTRNSFPAGDWKFESKNYNLNLSEVTTDLFGICLGDVNNSYAPAAGRQFIGLNLSENGVQSAKDGEWVDVRVDRSLELGALSLVLDIPAGVQIEQVVSNLSGGRFDYNIHNGQLRLTWFDVNGVNLESGQSLFRMRIATDASVPAKAWLVGEGSEMANPLAQIYDMVGLRIPSVRVLNEDLVAGVYPNPTNGLSKLSLSLPVAGEVRVRAVDVLGKTVASMNMRATTLNTELNLDLSHLANGRYELQVELEANGRTYRTRVPVQKAH